MGVVGVGPVGLDVPAAGVGVGPVGVGAVGVVALLPGVVVGVGVGAAVWVGADVRAVGDRVLQEGRDLPLR